MGARAGLPAMPPYRAPVEHCEERGYRYDDLDRVELGAAVRQLADEQAARLVQAPAARLRTRPGPRSWSVLEYGCHLRDVLTVQRDRIAHALTADSPRFSSMRREERAVEERYNDQDPASVALALAEAAEALARLLDGLQPTEWLRTGIYNYPTTRVRSVEWIARHTVHEARHHLQDVDRQLTVGPTG